MPYIMVPVPEQHVTEIMQRVLRLIQQESMQDWDEDAIRLLFTEADEPTRSLLAFVARATLLGKPLNDVAAAEAIQMSQRETSTILRDANETSRMMSRPLIFLLRGTTETLPNGRTVEQRLFVMPEGVARMIRNVEREVHEQESHPLLNDDQ